MIHGMTNRDFVLGVLSDYKIHFSREFVQSSEGEPLLLDYRKRISELREKGHVINSLNAIDQKGHKRPAYQLARPIASVDLFIDR